MSQQINLYQPMFRKQKQIFSATTIVEIAGVFVLGLLIIYGFARYQVSALEDQIAGLEAQRATAMSQLQSLSTQQSAPRSRLLASELADAEAAHQQKQSQMQAFETRRIGNTRGFSPHLSGLARQRVDGLWLTHVLIRDGGVELAGATEAGELLPRYLARLGREQAFAGTEFASLELHRGLTEAEPIAFKVATAPEVSE